MRRRTRKRYLANCALTCSIAEVLRALCFVRDAPPTGGSCAGWGGRRRPSTGRHAGGARDRTLPVQQRQSAALAPSSPRNTHDFESTGARAVNRWEDTGTPAGDTSVLDLNAGV